MASAADIPAELLSAERLPEFIDWCRRLPVDPPVKRRLVRAFSDSTGARLSAAQYDRVITAATPGGSNGPI